MSSIIDHSEYGISFTSDFDKTWAGLRSSRDDDSQTVVAKTFEVISDLLSGVDMVEKYGANSSFPHVWEVNIWHKENTGNDLVLNYLLYSHPIELDLRWKSVSDHPQLQSFYPDLEHREKNIGLFLENDSCNKKTYPITDEEEKYILSIFDRLGVRINEAYIKDEIDTYGDQYIDMFVAAIIEDAKIFDQLQTELDNLSVLFEINYESCPNGLGKYGTTYDFYHYFIDDYMIDRGL